MLKINKQSHQLSNLLALFIPEPLRGAAPRLP